MLKAMQNFLNYEKKIFPITPQRVAACTDNSLVSGRNFASYSHTSAYGPEYQSTFTVKGIWLPESECVWASASLTDIPAAFKKESAAKLSFLFLIHPESESLYQPLLQQFESTICHFQAISLSSVRSLLVVIPNATGDSELFFVKLSVNRVIGDMVRVLSKKECMSSIGNAIALREKHGDLICFMKDICAFVPAAKYIDRSAAFRDEDSLPKECGMIVREVPDFLKQPDSHVELVPFFSLFHDNGLLEGMVRKSGLTVTDFLKQFLLAPYAKAYVDLLFFHHVSIEGHGQNLLWLISNDTGLPCRIMYRDMGGVNLLLTDENRSPLPHYLQNTDYYYQDTHVKDAAESLEWHWAASVLFNLTKRLVRSEALVSSDSALHAWREKMQRGGRLCNWILPESEDKYRHQEVIPEAQYLRYGYVEELFKESLVTEVKRRRIPECIAEKYAYFPMAFRGYEDSSFEESKKWFQPFIYTAYSHWLALSPQNKETSTISNDQVAQ